MKLAFTCLLSFAGGLFCMGCKNYIGNAYRQTVPPRTVPALAGDLRVEPANWWTGMQHNQVEILVHRPGISDYNVRIRPAKGVILEKVEKSDSPNYLFLTLNITAEAPPQKVPLYFNHPSTDFQLIHEFPVYQRNPAPKGQGIDARDVLYLIYPDRFTNGDTTNDHEAQMLDQSTRSDRDGRHGGDLTGITSRLDYLQDLGITAIWLNPELENDMARTSYHGYAITDLYRIDRRLGTNEQYRELVRQCHLRGIKVVRDVVPNHIGEQHYWMQDLPQKDWINTWPEMTYTNFRVPALLDPYASENDKKHFSDGWFASAMPDLNQRNPHLAQYLIQQAIWWVEYAGIDAFRIDTYAFNDQAFMSRWCAALREEYPAIHLFGEIWENTVITQGFFAGRQPMRRARFDSNMPGVVDFQLCFALQEALTREQGWTEGAARIYYTLAQDYFYADPWKNVVMLDNHDMTRFFTTVGGDLNKFKSGIAFLLTTRGIPQLYYGTEILLTGRKEDGDDALRKEFPGGWPGDPADKFSAAGRTPLENEAFQYVRSLIRYRNATPALQTGRLMQFAPTDGLYVFFRFDAEKTILIALNTTNHEMHTDTRRFAERMSGFSKAKDVVSGAIIDQLSNLSIPQHSPLVLELLR